MDIVRKKICFDKFISHRDGIMPYYKKNGNDSDISYVTEENKDNNYGNFASDYVLINETIRVDELSGLEVIEKNELARMKYADVIKKYNTIKELLKNAVIVKKILYNETEIEYTDCVNGNIYGETRELVKWTTNFTDEITLNDFIIPNGGPIAIDISRQDRNLLNQEYLSIDKNNEYHLNESYVRTRDYIQHKIDIGEDVSEEEMSLYRNVNIILEKETNPEIEYAVIVSDYDFIIECDKKWIEWWYINWQLTTYASYYSSWENCIFDLGYTMPGNFKFLYDVEKYILCRVYVPNEYLGEEIVGTKVPKVITTTTYDMYRNWFEENQEHVYDNPVLLKEWNERGGDAFFDFLQSITFNFLPSLGDISDLCETYFTYAPPVIEMSLLFENEIKIEDEYYPYEYSVDLNGNVTDGTFIFSTPISGICSSLTPFYKEFDENEVLCESKLDSLISKDSIWISDDLIGIFSNFTNGGQLFRCTYQSGTSYNPLIIRKANVTTYEYTIANGEIVLVSENINAYQYETVYSEEIKPIVTSSCYQVVGITITHEGESELITNVPPSFLTGETIYLNGNINYPLSAITYEYYETYNDYSWWECVAIYNNLDTYEVADGETITDPSLHKYKNVLLLSCVPYLANDETPGNGYYFMAKYRNGNIGISNGSPIDTIGTIIPMDIPYVVGEPMNITSFDGEFSGTVIYDMVLSENINDGKIEINYAIGITSGSPLDTGIHYKETFFYSGNCCENLIIDGIYDAEIFYNKLFKDKTEEVYSKDLALRRQANRAMVVGMEVGTQWTSASCINALLITTEENDGIKDTPNSNVSIVFDRGASAAWENRFKLSECNTLEDLIQYGNNYFNI